MISCLQEFNGFQHRDVRKHVWLCDLCLKSVARDICICIVNISCVVLLRLTLTRNKMDYLSN